MDDLQVHDEEAVQVQLELQEVQVHALVVVVGGPVVVDWKAGCEQDLLASSVLPVLPAPHHTKILLKQLEI
eukprot:10110686-Prorocentrum_lima.AAC.1